jgi:hypothetical protein
MTDREHGRFFLYLLHKFTFSDFKLLRSFPVEGGKHTFEVLLVLSFVFLGK